MSWSGQASEHDSDHGEADEGGDGSGIALEIACQTAVAADPCECTLDNPSLGQDNEVARIAAFDDLQCPATGIGDDLLHLWPLIPCIREDALDEGKQTARRPQRIDGAKEDLREVGRLQPQNVRDAHVRFQRKNEARPGIVHPVFKRRRRRQPPERVVYLHRIEPSRVVGQKLLAGEFFGVELGLPTGVSESGGS